MFLSEAYEILEVDAQTSNTLLKENYRWLIKFYHPDLNSNTDQKIIQKIITAYNVVKAYRGI